MRILPGTHAPCELVADNGTVIADGTATKCAEVWNAITSESFNLFSELRAINQKLAVEVAELEKLRPLWAQGHSDDSVAAQTANTALTMVWDILGVDNQTACMAKLKEMTSPPMPIPDHIYYKPETQNFYRYDGTGMGSAFYLRWMARSDEFPVWIDGEEAAQKRRAEFDHGYEARKAMAVAAAAADIPPGITYDLKTNTFYGSMGTNMGQGFHKRWFAVANLFPKHHNEANPA